MLGAVASPSAAVAARATTGERGSAGASTSAGPACARRAWAAGTDWATGGMARARRPAARSRLGRAGATSVRAVFVENGAEQSASKSAQYNADMRAAMAWSDPYEYHHERGLYYHYMTPHLIVGTQPQGPSDVSRLREDENITAILNLQEDRDIRHWGVDIDAIKQRCVQVGVEHIRRPARDFDANSLRSAIPGAVAVLESAIYGGGRAYVHCTAGLGRAPAIAIAYLYWFDPMSYTLDEAYAHVTSRRPCGPKREAIRGATFDLLTGRGPEEFAKLGPHEYATLSDAERCILQYRVVQLQIASRSG